jgi:hypothetical protein
VGFTAKGKVTGEDYENIIVPLIERKLEKYPKICLLYHLGADCEGFEGEAMWDDAKVGLKHLTSWDKIALVTDIDWVRRMTKIFGFVLPAHVRCFPDEQLSQAEEWVSS